jgi:hypothetical protein
MRDETGLAAALLPGCRFTVFVFGRVCPLAQGVVAVVKAMVPLSRKASTVASRASIPPGLGEKTSQSSEE